MEPLLVAVSAAQSGVFSRAQALAAGYTDKRIRHLLTSDTWQRVQYGIFQLAGVPLTFDRSAWVVALAAGPDAVLSHRSAGKLHRLGEAPASARFDVSVPLRRRPRTVPNADVHRTTLTHADVGICNGLPVTSLARTIVDLARTLPLDIGSRIIADALRTSRVSVQAIECRIASLTGNAGIGRAKRALANADPLLESVLEHELLRLLRRAGFWPIAQYTVMAGSRFIARVDFAIPALRLAIEADGYATHGRRAGFERDRERMALLQLAGWSLLSFTAAQIRERPDWVIEVVRQRVRQLSAEQGRSQT